MRGSIILLGAILLPGAVSAATFQNGSFENGSFDQSTNPNNLGNNSTAMTGWTVIATGPANNFGLPNVSWDKNGNTLGLTASAGLYSLDLTGSTDVPGSGVQQIFDTLSGHNYSVSFDVGNNSTYTDGGIAAIIAKINGTAQFTGQNADNSGQTWAKNTFSFLATSGSTTLDLTQSLGGRYTGLDNVTVTDLGAGPTVSGAVPEPATWAMMIAGFGAIGAAMRRRSKANTAVSFA